MALSGSYTHVRSEGVFEHLVGNGFSEDKAKKAAEHEYNLEISIDGDNVTLTRIGEPNPIQHLTLNKENVETFEGRTLKNKAVLNGDVLSVDSNFDNGNWKREYALAGSELTVTLSSLKPGVPVGKRFYKKE